VLSLEIVTANNRSGGIMNKAQLVERIAQKTNLTKTDAEIYLDTTLDIVRASIARGDEVKLVGFGTFVRTKRKARVGRNPQTGKEVKIAAAFVPKFRPGKEFKSLVNK
jgi:DNA-binding protein HU-beta